MTVQASGPVPSRRLVDGVLAGDRRALARLISRAEAGEEECRPALADIHRHTGRAHIVGVTGVPGSGKSTLVRACASAMRAVGRTLGVVAVDPSSPFSGGAILGDRIRMGALAGDPGVFIRSMASRGALGGLAHAALDAVDLMDAAGFDTVLIETVGVGQDEVDIVRAADTTVVVSAPGLGDDIQAIKAGVLEIADIHVVSKSDRPDANRTFAELKQMLLLAQVPPERHIPVVATSAESGEGIDALLAEIDSHSSFLASDGRLARRRRRNAAARAVKIAEEMVRRRYAAGDSTAMAAIVDRMCARELDPHGAARALLATLDEVAP
ncbi:MAG: methylmalonyl Co-A mutase-associated GTPase MeaB [Rhodospirillales bacterium]|nr:methylmalonyl Co-A mutase-associated GTPase MeaB [Rhodospirillales bacterium]MCY4097677.1 methylmalonyl Co-A mutase-associated GTPase MeaB [Rhodospirillales bacterium]MYE20350.1 methylmalonyl Co-A mutase-associated GTPase MeaB [Rhodospirillales bacterium]